MRGATLRQMRAFALVARHRSFVQAAAELHLTPSAVSLQIKELEHAAGMPLFGRHARSLSMTHAGTLLLPDVQLALKALQHADDVLARLRVHATGRVAVGMVSSASCFLPRMLAQFRELHHEVDLHLVIGNRDKLLNHLQSGDVDLAIMGSPPCGFTCNAEAFAALPLGIIAAPEHELACTQKIAPQDLAAHFSDRGRLFQADRGRRFSAIVDARGLRASEVFNVSQSSTISLKRGLDGPLSMRP